MDRPRRNLTQFVDETEDNKPTEAQLEMRLSLQELVHSPAWEGLKRISEQMKRDMHSPIPSKLDHLIGFYSAGIAEKALDEFLRRVEQEAGGN